MHALMTAFIMLSADFLQVHAINVFQQGLARQRLRSTLPAAPVVRAMRGCISGTGETRQG